MSDFAAIQGKRFTRHITLDRASIDREKRTIEMSFSSEEPVENWYGLEILSHDPQAIRLGRLNGGAAVLVNHKTDDQVGVVERAYLGADRRGRAVIRLGRSPRATEIFEDVADGIRRNVSVQYLVHKSEFVGQERGFDVYKVTDWEPLELSIVSIPADVSVGVGRSGENERKVIKMDHDRDESKENARARNFQKGLERGRNDERNRVDEEQGRIKVITTIAAKIGMEDVGLRFIAEGKSLDEFRAAVLEKMGAKKVEDPDPKIGMTRSEVQGFSIFKLVRAMAYGRNDPKLWERAGLELEASRAMAQRLGREPRGGFIPPDVWQRDLNVGVGGQGGYTVATDLLAGSFIELLSSRIMVKQLGATVLDGLQGDVAIPKQSGSGSVYWLSEGSDVTESTPSVGQVAMTPKTVASMCDLTRRFVLQSSIGAEQFVRNDLLRIIALAIDLAAINGSGTSNQPMGILKTTGIGDVAGGTNGLAPTYDHMVNLESEVAIDNADVGGLAYLTNTKVRGKLKKTFVNTTYGDRPVYDDGKEPGYGMVNGYHIGASNQVPSGLDKGTSTGVCSAIIFGNWADLILGFWSGLDITADPFTLGDSGGVRIRAFQDVDIAVRHPESFAAMQDALTT